jgi:hypothetical protein
MQSQSPSRLIWPPQPGYFAVRLVRKGFRVPACINWDGSVWHAIIDEITYLPHTDPAHAQGVARIWMSGLMITEADYRWMIAIKVWARTADPDHPCLSPRTPIDPARLRPIDPSLRHPFAGPDDADLATAGTEDTTS